MTNAYPYLVVMLGIINMQQSHAQLLTDLNNNNLIKDFLNNFPEATVKQNEGNKQNILNNVTIEYLFPVNGLLLTPWVPDISVPVITSRITIAGKSFIGGSMEITVSSNLTTASFGNTRRRDNSSGTVISGRISNNGDSTNSTARLALEAMLLLIEVSPELNQFTLDDIILQFVAGDTDIPYNITESDRAMGDRIKNWLSNKLPVVVTKYQEYIDQLTNAGALILNDSLL